MSGLVRRIARAKAKELRPKKWKRKWHRPARKFLKADPGPNAVLPGSALP